MYCILICVSFKGPPGEKGSKGHSGPSGLLVSTCKLYS